MDSSSSDQDRMLKGLAVKVVAEYDGEEREIGTFTQGIVFEHGRLKDVASGESVIDAIGDMLDNIEADRIFIQGIESEDTS